MRHKESKLKVMLVDDKPYFRKGFKDMLFSQFDSKLLELTEAEHGRDFLEKMENYPANLVFIDIEMPVMNGIEATEAAVKRFPDTIIYGLSAFDDVSYVRSMAYAGAAGFISKNEDIKPRLQTIIADALNGSTIRIKAEKNIDALLEGILKQHTNHVKVPTCPFSEAMSWLPSNRLNWLRRLSRVEKINLILQHKKCLNKLENTR